MEVYFYGPDTDPESSMSTDHFQLEGGGSVSIELNLNDPGNLRFFGYVTTKNRSKQFQPKDKVWLDIWQDGEILEASTTSVVTYVVAGTYELFFKNDHKKTQKFRLRSEVV
jgi:hypothetical protein